MIKLALVGRNIAHSRSQEVYESILRKKIEYRLFDVKSEESLPSLDEIFKYYQGLSITSPYKKSYLQSVFLKDELIDINAINAIRKTGENEYEGTNTDLLALRDIFRTSFIGYHIDILGDGVMAMVTKKVCDELQLDYKVYSRKKGDDLGNLHLGFNSKSVIVNCCSRSYEFSGEVASGTIFYDYNYSFPPHQQLAKKFNIQYVDGFDLLNKQAEHALSFFGIK